MDVGSAEPEFAGARAQLNVLRAEGGDELGGDFLSAVGGGVVDDDDFEVEVTGRTRFSGLFGCGEREWVSFAYWALKVCSRSQTMMGRLRRSL
jgi:hypothetical protein